MNTKERVSYLFDKESVEYKHYLEKSGFLFGKGDINRREVYFIAFNSEEKAESLFEDFKTLDDFFQKIVQEPAPLLLMMDIPSHHKSSQTSSFPDDAQKMLASKFGVGKWYYNHAILSGKVPQIALVFDKMGASLTFPIALCDISLILEDAGMSIGRLDVVSNTLHEEISYEELGGAKLHAESSGSVDAVVHDEVSLLIQTKRYLSYLPQQSGDALPQHEFMYSNYIPIKDLIPLDTHHSLDMDTLIDAISDDGSFVELRESYAREIITGFATFKGHTTALMANRSKTNGGIFFPESSQKAARFVSLCDAYGIPIVFLSDSAGFMIGPEVERRGSIKYAAQLFSIISNSTTAKLSVSVRRNYTAGVYAMGGGGMMSDRFIALNTSTLSIYGDSVAQKLLQTSDTHEMQNAQSMLESANKPQEYLEMGLLDALIEPDTLRDEIIEFVSKYQDGSRASKKTINIA